MGKNVVMACKGLYEEGNVKNWTEDMIDESREGIKMTSKHLI